MIRWISATLLLSALTGCDGAEEDAPASPSPEEACPKVSMDNMSGKWIKFEGRAVKEYRFEILEEGGRHTLWYTGGGFTLGYYSDPEDIDKGTKKAEIAAGNEPAVDGIVE